MLGREELETQVYGVEDGVAAEKTRKLYKVLFDNFLDYCQLQDPAILLKEHPRQLENRIIGYVRFLDTTKRCTKGSINNVLSAIFHFFEMNDILLNKRKIKRFLPQDRRASERDRHYTHEEIQQILLECDERTRVMVLLMASTGIRIGAISEIRLGDLTEMVDYHLYKIQVYATSPPDRYYAFCTPECKSAIDNYLDFRRRFGDPLADKAPLIREQFDINDRFQAAYPRPVKYAGIVWIMSELLKRSGKKSKDVMQSHGFRKFAITQMIKAKVDYSTREYLVGHKHSRGLDVNYDRSTEEDRLQEYLKALDLLTINSENRLKRQIHQLESQHSEEWNALKAQMAELKQVLDHQTNISRKA
jgi:integrase